jgi:hypothetical protein
MVGASVVALMAAPCTVGVSSQPARRMVGASVSTAARMTAHQMSLRACPDSLIDLHNQRRMS